MLSASQLQSLAHGLFPPDEGTDCLVETERVFFLEKVGKAKFFVGCDSYVLASGTFTG